MKKDKNPCWNSTILGSNQNTLRWSSPHSLWRAKWKFGMTRRQGESEEIRSCWGMNFASLLPKCSHLEQHGNNLCWRQNPGHLIVSRKMLKQHFVGFWSPFFPPKPTDHPISCILSPPPHIVEITEPIKSTDYEPIIDDMPMLIMTLVMFQTCRRSITAFAQDLKHSFQMLHHR